MTKSEKIIKAVEEIENKYGYDYVGKKIKQSKTCYCFIDADSIIHYYSCDYIRNYFELKQKLLEYKEN